MNANIKFSREEEQNNYLPFLDVLVQRHGDGKMNTSVYRKSSTSDIVLHYSSNHPTNRKRLCVKTLFDRARLYCSDKATLTLNRSYLLTAGTPSLLLGVQCDAESPAKSRFKSGAPLLTTEAKIGDAFYFRRHLSLNFTKPHSSKKTLRKRPTCPTATRPNIRQAIP